METQLSSGTKAELIENPDNQGRALVIIPDVMDLRPLFLDMAKHLSETWGANVCTFQVFPEYNFDPTDDPEADLQNHYVAVKQMDDARLFADAEEAAGLARGDNPDVRLGLTGFCLGGMYTLKTMSRGVFNRGAAFYPQIKLPETWKGPKIGEPLDIITPESAARTLAIIGTIDPYTPPGDVEELEGRGVSTLKYEDCDHGFVHDPHRPAHRPEEAAQAWGEVEQFLFS